MATRGKRARHLLLQPCHAGLYACDTFVRRFQPYQCSPSYSVFRGWWITEYFFEHAAGVVFMPFSLQESSWDPPPAWQDGTSASSAEPILSPVMAVTIEGGVPQRRQLEQACPAVLSGDDGADTPVDTEKSHNLSGISGLAKVGGFKTPAYSTATATVSIHSIQAGIRRKVFAKGKREKHQFWQSDTGCRGGEGSSTHSHRVGRDTSRRLTRKFHIFLLYKAFQLTSRYTPVLVFPFLSTWTSPSTSRCTLALVFLPFTDKATRMLHILHLGRWKVGDKSSRRKTESSPTRTMKKAVASSSV